MMELLDEAQTKARDDAITEAVLKTRKLVENHR